MFIVEVCLVLAVVAGAYILLRLLLWLIAGKKKGLLWLLLGDKPKTTEPSDLLQQVTDAKERALELQRQYDKEQQKLKEQSAKLDPLTDKGSAQDTSGH